MVGALVDPGMTVASLSIPLVAPMTEYGDRINQLDLNVAKTFKMGRMTIQPKIDFFNVLNVRAGDRRCSDSTTARRPTSSRRSC